MVGLGQQEHTLHLKDQWEYVLEDDFEKDATVMEIVYHIFKVDEKIICDHSCEGRCFGLLYSLDYNQFRLKLNQPWQPIKGQMIKRVFIHSNQYQYITWSENRMSIHALHHISFKDNSAAGILIHVDKSVTILNKWLSLFVQLININIKPG